MAARADRRFRRVRATSLLLAGVAALMLAGCASVEEVGSYAFVQHDRYDASSCQDIAGSRGNLTSREKELTALVEKAESGGLAGTLVALTTYQTELSQVRANLRFLNQAAREKNCDAPPKR
jgi:hypothetical protein